MQYTLELTLMFPWPHLAVYATPPGTNDIGEQFAKNKSMTAAETGAATAARLAMLVNLTLQASHWCFVCWFCDCLPPALAPARFGVCR